MQVSVETTEGLERKLIVQVPAKRIDGAVSERLSSLKKTSKINGFRPGKVPMAVINKRFSGQVRGEVLGEVINSSFQEAVVQEKLRPAGYPKIDEVESDDKSAFTFSAVFEVYPEFEVANLESIKIEKPVVEVNDSDVDDMLETLRKQRTEWIEVEREAADGDQLTIDFVGTIDGEEFPGGKAENAPLVLGSNAMIPGFEEQLVGAKIGDDKAVKVSFPEDYHAKELAGKEAEFQIKVHFVKEPKLPEIDEEFVKGFGVESGEIDTLRSDISNNMNRELTQVLDSKIKKQVMDGLLSANEIEVPKALVDEEINRLRKQLVEQMPEGAEVNKMNNEMFESDAIRRVRLGLIIAEVVKANEIKADEAEVRKQIESIASSYQEPQQVVDYYYGNRELLQNVEGLVLEQQVCDWVISQAQVTEAPESFKDIMSKQGQ